MGWGHGPGLSEREGSADATEAVNKEEGASSPGTQADSIMEKARGGALPQSPQKASVFQHTDSG